MKRPPESSRKETAPPLATLTITINPPDSTLLINGEEVNYRNENGAVSLNAGSYTVTARRSGYAEAQRYVTLSPGQSESVDLTLSPLSGILNITTNVSDAEINIGGVGSFQGEARGVRVRPGQYEVTVTKHGYETVVQDISVPPDEVVNRQITMERIKPPPPKRDAAMSLITSNEGKYLVVSLTGSSGESYAQTGSIEVTIAPGDSPFVTRSVNGLLTGFPCRVDFVPLDNVAEFSFKESPGTHNQWRTVAVRVRPKNANRPMRFLITWQSLQRNGE